ncbi:glycosyltransferase [Enterovirga sp.]|uniref:glycosyltransferase n=1 Tax=Enterovirga sp. TaxID=2026350 RepID=UPI002633221D|nr:glycosyltransferase [Enterovirga sp.]MDB5591865.1 arnC 7 [Enterovirga sp.]
MRSGYQILSVNLEDYFQVAPMRRIIPERFWPRFDLRIERTTLAALNLLDRTGAKATFFVSGWVAERCPDLVAEVSRRGHDVASKGYHHRRFDQMSAEEFRSDLRRSRDAIERATGEAVRGYRIAEGSLPGDGREPLRILAEEGFLFDSSLRPFGLRYARHPDARRIHQVAGEGWSITEVPLSSGTCLGIPYPVTGGNYMRQVPRSLFERAVARRLRASDEPWHFYFHVWELDPEQPRVSAVSGLQRLRQYRNLETMRERVEHHLASARFTSIADHLEIAAEAVERRPEAQQASTAALRTEPARDVTIVVPCYNEEETLPYLAGNLASLEASTRGVYRFSYVFVDDGSQDQTWAVLNSLFGSRPNCQLVQHPANRGIAAATMTGIRKARDEIVCGIDCDCSFDPHDLTRMIPLLTPDVDMVQASPYHREGDVMNVPGWRLMLSRNLCKIYRRILHHKFSSYTACFRVYRRSALRNIELQDGGFMGIMEIFVKLDMQGSRIVEFPAVLATRLLGVSKMKTFRVIRSHIGLIARTLWSQHPERVPGKPVAE